MSVSGYFFNAVNDNGTYDRIYNAEDVTGYLDGFVRNGVFQLTSNALQVQPSSGMTVVVRAGQGWIDGHKLKSDSDILLTLDASDVLLGRIDRVIFYLDYTAREMGIEVLKGTAASSPVAPSLTRTGTRYEMCLAEISIAKQTSEISASMITDTRGNNSVCGFVAALIEQLDTSTMFDQWQDGFETWFNDVKDELTVVTLLQKVEQVFTTDSTVTTFAVTDYIPSFKYTIDILEIYVNGVRLDANEYNLAQTQVTLATPITHDGTEVSLVVYKSIDGSDAETIVEQVQEIQAVVDAINTGIYIATGDNDNGKLSQVVQAFLNGGDDYRQLELDVYGDLACTETVSTSGGIEYWFDFSAASSSTRRVKLNFAHASRVILDNTGTANAVGINAGGIEISNLQLVMNNCTAARVIEGNCTCEDSAFWLNGTGAGDLIGATQGTFDKCRFSVTNATGKAYGISANGNVVRLDNCELLAYNTSGASNEAVAVQVQANMTTNVLVMDACSCPVRSRGGYKQDNVVKINSGYYCLMGNMLGKAAVKYATGDGKTETGTMLVSK